MFIGEAVMTGLSSPPLCCAQALCTHFVERPEQALQYIQKAGAQLGPTQAHGRRGGAERCTEEHTEGTLNGCTEGVH